MMKSRRLWGAACTLLAAMSIAGCKQPETGGGTNAPGAKAGDGGTKTASVGQAPAYEGSDILIGEYGSLTGSTATFGQSSDKGIQMAVQEANAAGGILGKQVRVVVEDDSSRTEQVGSTILKLINQRNVLAIVGEVASSRSLAAAPICQKAGVPMVTPSSTNVKVTRVGDYIFRTCFTDTFQGSVNARFARENLKAKRVAVLTDNASDYSKGLSDAFMEDFKKTGGQIVSQQFYTSEDKDFRAQLTSIKGQNPDLIFLPGYYTEVGNVASQARSLGLQQLFLGGDGWDSPKLLDTGKKALQNSYFSNHYSAYSQDPNVQKFVAAYQKRYGAIPDAITATAYDATRLLLDAIKRSGGTDRAKIRDALAATKNFPGVTGSISIDQNRNSVKPITMLQIQGAKFAFVTTVKS